MATTASSPAIKPAASVLASKRALWIAVMVAAAVLLLVLALWLFTSGSSEPRLNENSVVLAKFVNTKNFDALPFDKQRQFYKVLENREKDLEQAFRDKRLSEPEYRTALDAAWLGKHINRTEKYFALPPGQARTDYINKLIDKKLRKNAKPQDPSEIDPDETAASQKVDGWPAAVKQQWQQFHTIYRAEKKAKEQSGAATQSVTPPKKKKKPAV